MILKPFDSDLFKAKSIKIATLFKTLKLNTFFKIEDPINLYHAERDIPSEPNVEVPPRSHPSERVYPSVNSQVNHFPYMEEKKQCIC